MNPYEPIFSEIATGLLEVAEIKPDYSDNAMLDVTIIFQSVFMDKIFDNQDFDNMPMGDRLKMAERAGEDLRKLIHTYTGLDTHKLVMNITPNRNEKTN